MGAKFKGNELGLSSREMTLQENHEIKTNFRNKK